ncbi:MAG: response regulator [Cyanobacteria bacterium P01_G01_bin.39]
MSVKPQRQRIQSEDSNVPIILVVEDEEDNLLFISQALIFLQYNFITATEGKAAFDLADKYEIDLVLLDLVLPDISGFDLANLYRQNQSTQKMPIIAISALARDREREQAIRSGCNDYLVKPYFLEDLDRIIRQYLPQSSCSYSPPWLMQSN